MSHVAENLSVIKLDAIGNKIHVGGSPLHSCKGKACSRGARFHLMTTLDCQGFLFKLNVKTTRKALPNQEKIMDFKQKLLTKKGVKRHWERKKFLAGM